MAVIAFKEKSIAFKEKSYMLAEVDFSEPSTSEQANEAIVAKLLSEEIGHRSVLSSKTVTLARLRESNGNEYNTISRRPPERRANWYCITTTVIWVRFIFWRSMMIARVIATIHECFRLRNRSIVVMTLAVICLAQ